MSTQSYSGKLRDPKVVWKKGYIKLNDKGDSVAEVEKFLNWYFKKQVVVVDKLYGSKTRSWVIKFQKDMNKKDAKFKVDGLWGHESWKKAKEYKRVVTTTTTVPKTKEVDNFLAYLEKIHQFVKANGKYFSRTGPAQSSWKKTQERALAKKVTGISCCMPEVWYFRSIGLSGSLYASNGSFKKKFADKYKKYLTRLTTDKAIGITLKQAVDKGYLKKGDILCFKGITHTVVYSGSGYKVYEGGGLAHKLGYSTVGIKLDYSKHYYKDKKISEICRWKDV